MKQQRTYQRQCGGQILPFLVIGMIPFIVAVGWLVNTGFDIDRKIRLQDASDAAAISQAAWTSRSMNVISMNNVAITQAFAVNIVSATLIPTLVEAQARTFKKYAEYYRIIAYCTGIGFVPCITAYGLLVTDLTVRVQIPLTRMFNGLRTRESADIIETLVAMNRKLAANFPANTANLQKQLALTNGLGTDVPQFVSGFTGYVEKSPDSTGLPIKPVRIHELKSPLCISGELGTPRIPAIDSVLDFHINWNFQHHGYRRNEGPFKLARYDANGRLNPILQAMNFHKIRLATNFDNNVRTAWPIACQTRKYFNGTVELFRVSHSRRPIFAGDSYKNENSIMAFSRNVKSPKVMEALMNNSSNSYYAYSQAEVFNDFGYDLFSQDWRARLTTSTLLDDINRAKLISKLQKFPELSFMFLGLSKSDLGFVNAH